MLANKLLSATIAPVTQTDPYFNYVAMLLHADGTNGANNNAFIDSSPNNFTITVGGSPTQGSLNPYSTNWSNYFNGSSSYMTVADNNALDLGTGDFTIECFVYVIGGSSRYPRLLAKGTYGQAGSWSITLDTLTEGIAFEYGTTPTYITALGLTKEKWHHFAVVRSGSLITVYLNGVSSGSATGTNDFTNTNILYLGKADVAADYLQGYLSNVRIVKGSALYTANFTTPTAPITAVAGTSLLTCQSNRFSDKSSNNFTVTMIGSSKVLNFSPFKESGDYSAGSLFFDDAGSYLRTPSNSVLDPSNGSFTWETWFYPNSFNQASDGGDTLLYTGATGGLLIGRPRLSAGNTWGVGQSGQAYRLLSSTLPINGQWNHMAVTRSGTGTNQTALWLNGVRVAIGTVSQTFVQGTVDLSSGYLPAGLDGWLADYRLLKGTALYNPDSTTYTIPTSPLTAVTNTSLLLSGKNAAIYDSVSKGDLLTLSNVQLNTSVKKFGTASLAFTSTGGRIRKYYDPLFDIVTGTFTFEAWVYPTVSSTGHRIFATGGGSAGWNNTNGIHVLIQMANGKLNLQLATNTSTPIGFSTTDEIPVNQWTFITVSVIGTTAYLGVNGNVVSGSVSTRARPSSNPTLNLGLIPGEALGSAFIYLGYMDEVRFTTGVARYTSSFTPPTAPFPNS